MSRWSLFPHAFVKDTTQVRFRAFDTSRKHSDLIQSNVEPERLPNHTCEDYISTLSPGNPNLLLGAYRHSKEYGSMYVCRHIKADGCFVRPTD